jgi:hypothetical protein
MINILYAVICGLVVVGYPCFGMNQSQWRVLKVHYNPTHVPPCDSRLQDCILRLGYKNYRDNANSGLCALFLADDKPVMEVMDCDYLLAATGALGINLLKHDTQKPEKNLYVEVCCESTHSSYIEKKLFRITEMRNTGEPERLLLLRPLDVILRSDCVIFKNWYSSHGVNTMVVEPSAVEKIRRACWKQNMFTVKFTPGNRQSEEFKVVKFVNDAYVYWRSWLPTFVGQCVGELVSLNGSCNAKQIEVDLEKNNTYTPTYIKNKRFGQGFSVVIICVAFVYFFGDAIKNMLHHTNN